MESVSFAQKILTALPYFIELEAQYLRDIDRKRFEQDDTPGNTYDFIIVGGGTAGCVVANRLSAHFSVLLLEGGGDPPSTVSVPAFDEYIARSTRLNFLYKGIPQPRANNRILDKGTGRMLGGTGSHNYLIYNRGNPKDFDNWAKFTGDPTWNYTNLIKYFKKSEKYLGIWPKKGIHGSNGKIPIETEGSTLDAGWKRAARALGYKYTDLNAPQRPGFGPMEITRKHGRRASSYTEYLQPVLYRDNLTVVRYAEAQKLLFSGHSAVGVKYLRHEKKLKAFASKEIIVCAGVLGTTLLLFKSGIGPSGMLRRAGIELRANLPAVGKYMQDHVGIESLPFIVHSSVAFTIQNNLTEADFEKLQKGKTSILSYIGVTPQILFVSSGAKARGESTWPDIQIRRTYCVARETLAPNKICFDVIACRPDIRRNVLASIRLNTSAFRNGERDNVKLAIIDDKVLKSKLDKKAIREGLKFLSRVLKTSGLRRLGHQQNFDEECKTRFKLNSIQYWNCYFAKIVITHHHTTSTCRMGREGDLVTSVVNSKLFVHKLRKLRIADASIMPRITNANTNAPIIVIAEKASDMIINQHT